MEPLEIAETCAEIALEKKCEGVLILDVRGRTSLADYFLLATARNRRQLKAVVEAMAHAVPKAPRRRKHVEGETGGRWSLLDVGDVVIHVFDPEARVFYDLESLWADAPRVPLPKETSKAAKRA